MTEGTRPSQFEIALFEASSCTSRTWQEYLMVFDLIPTPGSKVLDVGGGGSNITAWLLSQGVDAYAVDPLYKARSQVRAKVKQSMDRLREEYRGKPDWQSTMRKLQERERSLEEFAASAKQNPDRYVTGFATSLKFPDDHFDTVISFNCVTQFLDMDELLLTQSVQEMVRVVKPGGKVLLYPFNDAVYGFKDPAAATAQVRARRANHARLLNHLEVSHLPHEMVFAFAGNETLQITKPLSTPNVSELPHASVVNPER